MEIVPETDHMAVHRVDRSATDTAVSRGGQGYRVLGGREGRTTCQVPVGSRFPMLVLPPPPSGRGFHCCPDL